MKRCVLAATLPLILGGCLPIPLSVSIASYAIDGVSYLASGKSTTDHVISAATKQDCALTRPVFGDPICRDLGPNGEGETKAITVAYYPGDDVSRGDRPENKHKYAGALNLDEVEPEATQIALFGRFLPAPPAVEIDGVVANSETVVPSPDVHMVAAAPQVSWTAPSVPVSTVAVEPLGPPAAAAAILPKPRPTAIAAARRVVDDHSAAKDRLLVLGSFRTTARAEVLQARFAGLGAHIVSVSLDNRDWYRVAVGPISPAAARDLKAELGRVDGRQPWVIRLSAAFQVASH